MSDESVKCRDCGFVFQADDLSKLLSERSPCPNCGSLKRAINVIINEKVELSEHLKMEMKKPSSRHKRNRASYEAEQGMKKGKNGKLVFKRKLIDREHPDSPDSYVEFVRDKEGNIIVNKSEKLSEHGES